MTLRVSPHARKGLAYLLEHWNIGTNGANLLICKVKFCSKPFSILEQTGSTAWNKTKLTAAWHKLVRRRADPSVGTGFVVTGLIR